MGREGVGREGVNERNCGKNTWNDNDGEDDLMTFHGTLK